MSQADQASVEHADSPAEPQQRAKVKMSNILAHRPGRENAISSAKLAQKLPVNASTVRDLIPQVIEEYRLPITSCQAGYYLLRPNEDHDDFVRAMERYESQAETAQQRARSLAAAYNGQQQSEGWT